jgi:hypothetical protein
MAGKSKMSGDELDDPSLLVPETPDQTHRTFINPEHRLRRLESMIDEYEDTQKAILQKLNLLTANIDVPPTPPRKASPNSRTNSESSGIISTIGHTVHTPAPRHERPKAAIPESFNGDRKKGRAFLTSCQLYMNLRRTEFTDEQDQIQWVLSYMKSGRAATFAQRTLRKEFRTKKPAFANYQEFHQQLELEFCEEDETTHALMRLESDQYHQGLRTISEFIDEFQELVDLSGLTDPIAIVLKFRRGLNPAIQDKIGESESRPDNADIEGWYTKARRIDLNRLTNLAFNTIHTRPTATRTPPTFRSVLPRIPFRTPPPIPTVPNTPPKPTHTPDGRHAGPHTQCHLCKTYGHFARNCHMTSQIRGMSADDRREWLEHLMATVDAADAVDRLPEITEDETVIAEEEDFPTISG